MDKTVYIHYGSTQFNPAIYFPIRNDVHWTKPIGGLWASRKNASFGWKDWCAAEDYKVCTPDNSFEFVMKDESKVVKVSNLSQLHQLPRIEDRATVFGYNIDFEKCVQMGIDAIELCWYGNEFKDTASDDLESALGRWDCDSIVVLNPDAVIPLTGGNVMICEICGKKIEKSAYMDCTVCSSECWYEAQYREWYNNRQEHPDRFIVCDGQRYVIGDEDSTSIFRGFGGRTFHIQFLDTGKIVTTTNLWHNGDIPDAWRERLPDTVKFISEAEYNAKSATDKTSAFDP